MSLQDRTKQLRDRPLPDKFQGISKARIRAALKAIDRESVDMVDAIFALLDNETLSFFSSAKEGARFCDGASTQQIATHVGTMQRDGTRLDREGRDYWIKPLRDIGAIEPVYLQPNTGSFVLGHPVPKSPNSAYRLAAEFRDILAAPESEWELKLRDWIRDDKIRARLELQANLANMAKSAVDTKHSDLIKVCCNYYAPAFLPGYAVIYIDDGDGERITETQRQSLAAAGIHLELGDAMPDVLLWNAASDSIWVIEAVTSDGEVDYHKVSQLTGLANRSNKNGIGFTTAYQTWKIAASRQARFKNLPPETYLWIMEDPSKHFHAIEPTGTPQVEN
jgi:hypothetical protein